MNKNKIKLDPSTKVIRIISYAIVTLWSIICIFPFVLVISASFSTESIISREGFGLLPKGFTVSAYEWVFRYPEQILGSYAVTIIMTVCGTVVGLFIIAMTGYALQRKDFPLRNIISFFIYFTTLFSAGMVPTYLWVSQLGLRGSYLAVFLQLLMSPWLIVLMKNFAKSVPYEITESGKIDGAGDFRIFISLIFPMLKPALATVGLFLALGYWNEWYQSSLYLGSSVKYKPLQYYLYGIINQYGLKMVGGPVGGFLADKALHSTTKYLRIGFVIVAIILGIFSFLPHESMGIAAGMTITLCISACVYSMRAVYFAPMDEVSVPREITGSAMSMASFIGYLPGAFMYAVYGGILDSFSGLSGYRIVFIMMTVFAVCGVLLSTFIVRKLVKKS